MKKLFNIAACVVGATTSGLGYVAYEFQRMSLGGWVGGSSAPMTGTEMGIIGGGAALFVAGCVGLYRSRKKTSVELPDTPSVP